MEELNLKINIASRRSVLAQVQTDIVIDLLHKKHGVQCEKLLIETIGDKILDVTLDKIGGKGLFVKDIEIAIQQGKADAAVHSMKDVPYEMPEGFEMAALLMRADVRDVFISLNNTSFYDLPKGAKVGTSSNRRKEQIKHLRPDIEVVPVRGNVQTRINKIETEGLDGVILAAAGLNRLGLEHLITDYFEPEEFVPAVGQGALGIEALSTNPNINMFRGIDNSEVSMCVKAERSFMRTVNGDCHTAVGAYARIEGESMNIIGLYAVNGRYNKMSISGSKYEGITLGQQLGLKLLNS
jgi:hydroxymethylbilane synthase